LKRHNTSNIRFKITSTNNENNYTRWFFSESSISNETAKQTALERIVKDSFQFLKNTLSCWNSRLCSFTLENDELFNAGIGSNTSWWKIRMSAVMDGETQNSAVSSILKQWKPSSSRQKTNAIRQSVRGSGATNFARKMVLDRFQPRLHSAELNLSQVKFTWTGTVGCSSWSKRKIAVAIYRWV
jgi:L-asparaginase